LVQFLRPKNEEQEKEKFRYYWEAYEQATTAEDKKKAKAYNPRFQYNDSQRAQQVVQDMRQVFSTKYRSYARAVVDEVIRIYGTPTAYKEQVWGKELSRDEVMAIAQRYMQGTKLYVDVFFGKSLVTTMSGHGLSLVGTPNYYREVRFKSLLDHEIGTHYIRSQNQSYLDPGIKAKIKKKRVGWLLASEEGLASLCNQIHYTKCDLFFGPALLYYGVCVSMENSFWETFRALRKFAADFDDCWL
jgi:hypothetical protein